MAPQNKRAAQQPPTGMPEAKRRVASLLKQQGLPADVLKTITGAIEHPFAVEGVPEDVRQMLVAMLPFALCIPSDQRSNHQKQCVTMVGEVLASVEVKLKEAYTDEVGHLAANDAQKALVEGLVVDAESHRAAAAAAVSACEQAVEEAAARLSAKQQVLAERQEEQKKASAERQQHDTSRSGFEDLLAGTFSALQDRAGEVAEVDRLKAVAGELGLDESLVTALPNAISKQPAERGPFDKLLLDQLAGKVQSKISTLRAQVEADDATLVAQTQAIAESGVEIEEAAGAKKSAEERLQAARDAEAEQKTNLGAAKATAAEHLQKYSRVSEVKCARERELEVFRSSCVAAYAQLRDRVSAKRTAELAAQAPGQAVESTAVAQAGA